MTATIRIDGIPGCNRRVFGREWALLTGRSVPEGKLSEVKQGLVGMDAGQQNSKAQKCPLSDWRPCGHRKTESHGRTQRRTSSKAGPGIRKPTPFDPGEPPRAYPLTRARPPTSIPNEYPLRPSEAMIALGRFAGYDAEAEFYDYCWSSLVEDIKFYKRRLSKPGRVLDLMS